MNELSYFDKRMSQLGITDELNKIDLVFGTNDKGQSEVDQATGRFKEFKRPVPIFRKHDKGIEIIVYTIDRLQPQYTPENTRYKKSWSIIRLEKPIMKENGDTIKYVMPKGQNSFPFFPPELVTKYDNKTHIQTLIITEGYFKARKAAIHGLDIIGVPSITHLKNKEKGTLATDIINLIQTCTVSRVIWLLDGDCLDVSTKEKADLYKRPASFFASINTFKTLLDDYQVDKYFAYVDTDSIASEFKKPKNECKGIDDIMCSFPDLITDMVEDINSVSKNGFWFTKFNITYGLSKVVDLFRINNVNTFYLFHLERGELHKGKEFTFHGTQYRYIEEKGECEVLIPAAASSYFRVGDDYYKFIIIPNKYKQDERHFDSRLKSTIQDDHGKNFLRHIPKYEAFCNVPDHINFQQVIHNCFNVYSPLDKKPLEEECTEEDCTTILAFLRHVFSGKPVSFTDPKTKQSNEYELFQLALDYIQLLYQRPWEPLPILCLVSKENNTGKTTTAKLLKHIFGSNCAVVGNADLAGDFNKHWSTKTIVICDETKIDKQTVLDKVKSLSTADKIMMNAKGKDHVEIDCFIKFIFITNNENNFIYATEEDVRYWVIKVPTFKEENPELLGLMIEEIPAFLSYLNKRKLCTEKLHRAWFHPALLKTEALRKVIDSSKPAIEKEIRHWLKETFLDYGLDELLMTKKDLIKECFRNKNYELNYIEQVVSDNLGVERIHRLDESGQKIYKTARYSYPTKEQRMIDGKLQFVRVDITDSGRPFVFKRSQFVTTNENVELDSETHWISKMTPEHNGHATVAANDTNGNAALDNELPF